MARKRWRVEFTDPATADLQAIRDYIAQDRPAAVARWLREVKRRTDRLRTMPFACEAVPEVQELEVPLRHIIYGSYRILYLIDEDRVTIIRIVHAARKLTHRLLQLEPPATSE